MYCRKCGKEIDDNAKFCSGCGESTVVEQQKNTVTDENITKRNSKKALWIGLAVVAIVLIVFVVGRANESKLRVNDQLTLGNRYLSQLDYEKAIAAYKAVIEIDPKNVDAYIGLADAYIGLEDEEQAAQILEVALSETGDDRIQEYLQRLKDENVLLGLVEDDGGDGKSIIVGEETSVEETSNGYKGKNTFDELMPENSMWFDGMEVKVIEDIDSDMFKVKMNLDGLIVQMELPKELPWSEFKYHDCGESFVEYYGNGEKQCYLKLHDTTKDTAVHIGYGIITDDEEEEYIRLFDSYRESVATYGKEYNQEHGDFLCGTGQEVLYIYGDNSARISGSEDFDYSEGYTIISYDKENHIGFTMELIDSYDQFTSSGMLLKTVNSLEYRLATESDYTDLWGMDGSSEDELYEVFDFYRDLEYLPSTRLEDLYGIDLGRCDYYMLYDFTGEGLPEILFSGVSNGERMFCIANKCSCVKIYGDEMRFSYEKGIIYNRPIYNRAYYQKYRISLDSAGKLVAECVDDPFVDGTPQGYYEDGWKEIDAARFTELYRIVNTEYSPAPKLYDGIDQTLTKHLYRESFKQLNSFDISENQ